MFVLLNVRIIGVVVRQLAVGEESKKEKALLLGFEH